jgi:hypothetical protein
MVSTPKRLMIERLSEHRIRAAETFKCSMEAARAALAPRGGVELNDRLVQSAAVAPIPDHA